MKGEVAVVGPYGLCGRKATVKLHTAARVQELCEGRGGRCWSLWSMWTESNSETSHSC